MNASTSNLLNRVRIVADRVWDSFDNIGPQNDEQKDAEKLAKLVRQLDDALTSGAPLPRAWRRR